MKKIQFLLLSIFILLVIQSVAQAQTIGEKTKLNVAIFIFDGVQVIDYSGPFEVLAGYPELNVYTVAEKLDPITTVGGMSVNPKYNFENQPKPDILLLPGGLIGRHTSNPKVLQWIQESARNAKYVLSVCNGAFFLARAGLLDGLEATTTANNIDSLRDQFPKIKIVRNKRVVDNGKFMTTGGLSAGIEGALHLVSKLFGEDEAQLNALGLEYHWDRNSTFLPGNFARRFIRPARWFLLGLKADMLSAKGNEKQWQEVMVINTGTSSEELLKRINNELISEAKWTPKNTGRKDKAFSQWKFTDETGKFWNGTVDIENDSINKNKLIIIIKIIRQD